MHFYLVTKQLRASNTARTPRGKKGRKKCAPIHCSYTNEKQKKGEERKRKKKKEEKKEKRKRKEKKKKRKRKEKEKKAIKGGLRVRRGQIAFIFFQPYAAVIALCWVSCLARCLLVRGDSFLSSAFLTVSSFSDTITSIWQGLDM